MSTVPSQADCFVSVTTPFGADALLLDGFGGREAISEPFHFDLRMHSTNKALDAQTIIGKAVTVTVKDQVGTARYFNGIVKRFAHTGANSQYGFYSAELAPRLWLLTLGQDRMIYQNQSALDIVKAVLGTFQVPLELRISGDYAVREYCVQYDESAFAFISRLMEEEGIFYFFTFANGAHTMVLADSASAHEVGQPTLYFSPDSSVAPRAERVGEFAMTQDIVSGVHVLADYDYLTAASSTASSSASASVPTGRRFTFPGKYATSAEGTRKSAVRLAAQTVQQQTGRGAGYCYALTAGTSFTLSGHVNSALNVSYVVRAVTHTASNDTYSNEFHVFPESVPFRAPLTTPRPLVAGTHTAKVVGSSGEEIWTDSNGRVKLKFYWDGSAGADENSSCWVRVSQSSAGQGWGHLFLPRMGQEVVVSYVDGDPDRPLVTGSVYNGENATPVALPSLQTQSVMRSRSSKGGTAGNEIRMEDKLDSEELYFHAQKDMNVAIENGLTTTLIAGAESHVIQKGDRTIDVQTGKETHTVKGTRTLDVTGDETHTNHAAFTQNVSGNYTLKVTGNLVIDVTGSISIKAGTSLASEGGTTHASKAGTTLSGEGMTISHKASATQTVDGGGMLALKGGLVKLN
ncbi:type VI secretion system tip protein TssI/VgrG [Caballeronia sordidicola]|uniref:type VI secretion system tip protein TssI/VgrG n=1 Tax=Caballeronia sordidicola TaxID=196367 RepID=UPI0004D02A99|nr:type VI secretion system tip protein TssI/VgrG [Caballeronia sordidicola]